MLFKMEAFPKKDVLTLCVFTMLFEAVLSDDREVSFFDACYVHSSYGTKLEYDETVSLKIDGSNWPRDGRSCSVIFSSYDNLDDLSYKFTSFDLYDNDVTVTFEDRYTLSYDTEAEYTARNPPSIDRERETNTYLRITVNRDSISDGLNLNAVVEIWNSDYRDDDIIDNIVQNLGAIIGGVVGAIALIVIVVIIICVCCVAKSKRRRANRPPPTASYTTHGTTAPNQAVYPYVAAPPTQGGQYAPYPMQAGAYSAGYPAQPGGYPAQPGGFQGQPTSYQPQAVQQNGYPAATQPPSYESLGFQGNTKIEPSAPENP